MSVIALLAPVPLEHLRDGAEVCESQGKVAFGSRAWDGFRELDENREAAPVEVFIHASVDPSADRLEVSWRARYLGHVNSVNGAHPEGMRFRPPSTGKYPSDNRGHWAVFWEVDQLRELSPAECIPTGVFIGYKTGKPYKRNFAPEGPLLVIGPA